MAGGDDSSQSGRQFWIVRRARSTVGAVLRSGRLAIQTMSGWPARVACALVMGVVAIGFIAVQYGAALLAFLPSRQAHATRPVPPVDPGPVRLHVPVNAASMQAARWVEWDIPGGGVVEYPILFETRGVSDKESVGIDRMIHGVNVDWDRLAMSEFELRIQGTNSGQLLVDPRRVLASSTKADPIAAASFRASYSGGPRVETVLSSRWQPRLGDELADWRPSTNPALQGHLWDPRTQCAVWHHWPQSTSASRPRYSTIVVPRRLIVRGAWQLQIDIELIDKSPEDGQGVQLSIWRERDRYLGIVLLDSNRTSQLKRGEDRLAVSSEAEVFAEGRSVFRLVVLPEKPGVTEWTLYRSSVNSSKEQLCWRAALDDWSNSELVTQFQFAVFGRCDVRLRDFRVTPVVDSADSRITPPR